MLDISFIIPVYNVSAYLKDFFEPFKLCKLSCEIIFINDGSTDSSAEILQELAVGDPRVIIINKKNGGVSSARNAGICRATGRFISCLDPDDIISPNFFKCIEFSLDTFNDVDTIIYGYEKFHDGILPEILNVQIEPSAFKYLHKNALSSIHNYPWLRVVRRDFYTDNLFPEGVIYEDSVTIPVLNAQAEKVIGINAILYYYRVRKDSLTNFNVQRNMELVTALTILEGKVEKHPEYRPNLYSCVAHLSRSALITLTKTPGSSSSAGFIKKNHKIIFSKFNRYPLSVILRSDANYPDKICFVLLKMHMIGFICFKILYKIISK
ncbi:glycosyltransferase family 2 protein [Enterobacter soli]|uniref:glycosyltransferase family 2 protein n=1 Tax=Enterobacter soli TaxID=885040 RepID=UPI003EDB123C